MKVLDKNRNFLGLPDEFSGFKQARVVILPVPYERTSSYVDGSKKGPEALLEASSQLEDFDEELNTVIYRCCKGIATLEPMQFASETAPESIERIRQVVSGLLEMGKYVVSLGGEHTFSLGPVRAHYDHYGDSLSLLQLDAHKDFRDDYLGDPFSHASVMARMLEFIPSIVQLGIRSHCREELEIQHADRVSTFYAHSIKSGQMPDWQDRVLEALSDRVYLTIDCDFFDPSVIPSVGTPEPGGFYWYETLAFLRKLCAAKSVVGFDICEFAPIAGLHYPDFTLARLIYKLLGYIFYLTSSVYEVR